MYKSRAIILNPKYGPWVVVYTERMLRICAAFFMAGYAGYRLCYVTTDLIAFSRVVGVMSVALGTGVNVPKCLKLFDIIESTPFKQLPSSWREETSRSVDHHPGRTGAVGDFVYYNPWEHLKLNTAAA